MGEPTDSRHPFRVAQRGVAHVAEDRSLFFGLTVMENLQVVPGLPRSERQRGIRPCVRAVPAAPSVGGTSGGSALGR